MTRRNSDAMDDAITRMKFGMTVDEARARGICMRCLKTVHDCAPLQRDRYENSGLCPDCFT